MGCDQTSTADIELLEFETNKLKTDLQMIELKQQKLDSETEEIVDKAETEILAFTQQISENKQTEQTIVKENATLEEQLAKITL